MLWVNLVLTTQSCLETNNNNKAEQYNNDYPKIINVT